MRPLLFTLAAACLFRDSAADAAEPVIPQDAERQEQHRRDLLAWTRATLGGAYNKVGKRDPKWDEPARQTLEALARRFSAQSDPHSTAKKEFALAEQTVNLGCDDPLILYAYAWLSQEAKQGRSMDERVHFYVVAGAAMADSGYPPFRRALALGRAAQAQALYPARPKEAEIREAVPYMDAALALLPQSLKGENNPNVASEWLQLALMALRVYRAVPMTDAEAAFERVDNQLAQVPEARVLRLKFQGTFWMNYAWEGRGSSLADSVTPERWQKFGERLTLARDAYLRAWDADPSDGYVPSHMLVVDKGLGGDREEMERWFRRAMQINGDDLHACLNKLDWLAPKWHGSPEEVVAFGRACRDTKNWHAGLPLLLPTAYRLAYEVFPDEERTRYMHAEDVWKEIRAVFDEHLSRRPEDRAERCRYAVYSYLCGHKDEAARQFDMLGASLDYPTEFQRTFVNNLRENLVESGSPADSFAPAGARSAAVPVTLWLCLGGAATLVVGAVAVGRDGWRSGNVAALWRSERVATRMGATLLIVGALFVLAGIVRWFVAAVSQPI